MGNNDTLYPSPSNYITFHALIHPSPSSGYPRHPYGPPQEESEAHLKVKHSPVIIPNLKNKKNSLWYIIPQNNR